MYLLSAFLFSVRRALIPSCRAGLWALWMAGVAVMAGCANTSPPPGVKAVTPFDLQRYQGRWYELARLDHSFERGMTDVSATYTPQADGSVRVSMPVRRTEPSLCRMTSRSFSLCTV